MPLNKEALIRYRVINRCLVDYKIVSKQKLIEACENALDIAPIGARTIEQDIHDMREDSRLGFHAPIKFDRIQGGYYYADPHYSIDNLPITEDDLHALAFAATMLHQYRHVEMFSAFTGAVQKIIDAVNIRRLSEENSHFPFIEFEQSLANHGNQYLEPIIMAIKDKIVIRITYHRFNVEESHTHLIHPYLLKEYHNRWYLIGWNEAYHAIRTYGLDRIKGEIVTVDLPYHDIAFNTQEYFRSVIGITSSDNRLPEKVVLKIAFPQAYYPITQPIHASQQVVMNSGHALIELMVIPTYELIMLILGWGPEVTVLEPHWLKEKIQSLYQKCLGNYQ